MRELTDSYKEEDTQDGWTIERHFMSSWTEWLDGGGILYDTGGYILNASFSFPIVGDEMENRPQLTVSHRRASAVRSSNELCDVTIFYSTKGTESRSQTENQIGSWEERLDISVEQKSVKSFENNESPGVWKNWETLWTAEDANNTIDNIPDLVIFEPTIMLTVTAYSDKNYRKRILDNVGKTNSTHLIVTLAAKKQLVDPKRLDDTDGGFDDEGKWLFYGATMRRVRNTSYQYSFVFSYRNDTWNKFEGVEIDHYIEFDMVGLLDDMDNVEADFWGGTRK